MNLVTLLSKVAEVNVLSFIGLRVDGVFLSRITQTVAGEFLLTVVNGFIHIRQVAPHDSPQNRFVGYGHITRASF